MRTEECSLHKNKVSSDENTGLPGLWLFSRLHTIVVLQLKNINTWGAVTFTVSTTGLRLMHVLDLRQKKENNYHVNFYNENADECRKSNTTEMAFYSTEQDARK